MSTFSTKNTSTKHEVEEIEENLSKMRNLWERVNYLKKLPQHLVMKYLHYCWQRFKNDISRLFPYLIPAISKLRVVASPELEGSPAAISEKTIYINPYIWCALEPMERLFVIIHELLHGFALHPIRGETWIESKSTFAHEILKRVYPELERELVAEALSELLNIVYDSYINDILLNMQAGTSDLQPFKRGYLYLLESGLGLWTRDELSRRSGIPLEELTKKTEEETATEILEKLILDAFMESLRKHQKKQPEQKIEINLPRLLEEAANILEVTGYTHEANMARDMARQLVSGAVRAEQVRDTLKKIIDALSRLVTR